MAACRYNYGYIKDEFMHHECHDSEVISETVIEEGIPLDMPIDTVVVGDDHSNDLGELMLVDANDDLFLDAREEVVGDFDAFPEDIIPVPEPEGELTTEEYNENYKKKRKKIRKNVFNEYRLDNYDVVATSSKWDRKNIKIENDYNSEIWSEGNAA